MPTPEKSMVYFAFSIAIKGRIHVLGDLISEMNAAGITVQNLSGFVSGRRHQLFCIPTNADKFRAFAKKRQLRLREKTAVKLAQPPTVMSLFLKWALSGDLHPAWSISSQTGFVYP